MLAAQPLNTVITVEIEISSIKAAPVHEKSSIDCIFADVVCSRVLAVLYQLLLFSILSSSE